MKVSEGDKIQFAPLAEGSAGETGVVAVVYANQYDMVAIRDSDGAEVTLTLDDVIKVLGKGEVKTAKSKTDFRREAKGASYSAYRALAGKPGLTEVQQAKRLLKARARLEEAQKAVASALAMVPGEVVQQATDEYEEAQAAQEVSGE